jgi:hypothetical protein
MSVRYIGNGAYCYANSLAMLLSTVGASHDPGYLECLTAVAIGALSMETPKGPIPFFSIGLPDQGVTLALQHLGYAFDRASCSPGDDPAGSISLGKLRQALASGPVLVGPLDMSQLTYMPNHERLVGADHFVVLYSMDHEHVFLHDPAGFAYVALPLNDFRRAWRAENIEYRPDLYPSGAYSMWWNVRQTRQPSTAEVFALTDQQIQRQLRWQREYGDHRFGSTMIRQLAEQVRTGVPDYFRGQLGHFALPLGARRCADFAQFYAPYDQERAQIKEAQGRCFGTAFVAFVQQDYERLSTALHEIANHEAQFQQRTLQLPHLEPADEG